MSVRFIKTKLIALVALTAAVALTEVSAHDAEAWANTNLIFAKTAGQDVIRQAKAMAPEQAHHELNWLLSCQAETTLKAIAAQPW